MTTVVLRTLSVRSLSLLYYQSANVKEEKRHGSIPFFTCQCGCSCAAGAPVAASLTREITQSCSFGYILLYPFYFFFVLCLSLSYDMICIFIRGGEPLWSVDYCRLRCTLLTSQLKRRLDKYPPCHKFTLAQTIPVRLFMTINCKGSQSNM